MSDFNSSLPIRTENNGDAVVKVVDFTTNTQGLAIDASGKVIAKMNDGAGNAITSQVNGSQQALDVGINVAGAQVDPRSIRSLTSSDVVTANIKDATGTAFSALNPLPVTISADGSGDEINSYLTSAAVGAGSSVNHDYTVTAAKTLILRQIEATGSGKAKIEVQIETGVASGVFVSFLVLFSSTANPNMSVHFDSPKSIAAGVRVRVIRTNKDNQAQDLYSTISGQEI